jgi:diguanylate cyclase (GGDEF)-like protein/PAS domain S-box-containing protein
VSGPVDQHERRGELAADALLREHPDALVCGLSGAGLIVPVPQSVALWGQTALEGRAVTDLVIAEDRKAVADLWIRVQQEEVAKGKMRLLSNPSRFVIVHFLDLRESHDVLMCVMLPSDEVAEREGDYAAELPPAPPRFSTLMEDEGGKVLDCDDAFTAMFGYTAEELIGKSVLEQLHPEDQGRAVESWITMLSSRHVQQSRLRRRRKDGSWMWVDLTLHNYLNQPDQKHVLVEIIDVSAEMAALEELERRATIDTLTQCFNRHSILGELERELEQGNSAHTAVIYLDLDGFKAVNDTLGHAAGDEVLALVAERLKVASRDGDDIGRLGGDEFLVLLRGIPRPDVAMRAAERMCEAIGSDFELSSGTAALRASVGVACANTDASTGEELVRRADAAMYKSKDQGQGRPVLAEESHRA